MNEELKYEKRFWGKCLNTFDEEQKHYVYAKHMGIPILRYRFDAQNKSILDIGAGPVSMLLKCKNLKRGKVIDPIRFPDWVLSRYQHAGIEFEQSTGEAINETGWDEAWIYNCLQHVSDPESVLTNAKKAAKIVRVFEWLKPAYDGHPIALTKESLDHWLNGKGDTKEFSEQGCFGLAYFGIFKTNADLNLSEILNLNPSYQEYNKNKKHMHLEHQIGRICNLEAIVRRIAEQKIPGDFVEFGVFEGASFCWLARLREKYCLYDRKLIGIDSFEGLPSSSGYWAKGQFKCSAKDFCANIRSHLTKEQRKNIKLITGRFSDPSVKKKLHRCSQELALVHIDSDLGKSATEALNLSAPYLQKGTHYLCFDEWAYGDQEKKAFEAWLNEHTNISAKEFSRTRFTKYFILQGSS